MSSTNNCPDCGSALGKSAYKCRCGWKKAEHFALPAIQPNCAEFQCQQAAMVGSNRCKWHFEHEHQVYAAEYAEKHGLVTVKDHIKHCTRLLNTVGTHWTRERIVAHWQKVRDNSSLPIAQWMATEALQKLHYQERTPGEDDERLAA